MGYEDADEDDEPEDESDHIPYIEEARCLATHLKSSPWKFRRVLYQLHRRSYRDALMMLEFMPWRVCKPILTALQSAAANAVHCFNMDKSRLFISRMQAMEGP